jgi:hypothetical protein
MTTEEAVTHLQKALSEDKEYYYGWQSNIAMAFKDEYHKQKALGYTIEDKNIHEIANAAAVRFLDILMINI